MRGIGSPRRGSKLAMSAGHGPWGGGHGDGTAPSDPVPARDDAASPGSGKAEAPNPWKSGDEEGPSRRSANIDDIFRGRGRRRRPDGAPPAGPGLARLALPLGAALALGALAASAVHVLDEGEQGLVTTAGRYERTIGPGFALTLPWPLQQVSVHKTAEIAQMGFPAKGGEAMLLTRDQFMVNMAWQLRWKVRDLKAFSYAAQDPEETLRRLGAAQMRAAVAEMPFDGLWDGTGQGALQDRVRQRLQAVLDAYGLGVAVEGVEVVRADPPARLADAFRRVSEVREEARKDQNTARKFAEQTLTKAEVETAEFDKAYAEYKAAPGVTRQRMYYETMEKVLGNNRKVVVGAGVNATVALPPAGAGTAEAAGKP